MEAACFFTSKPFGKTPDLIPQPRTRALVPQGRRRHCSLRHGGASPSSSTILRCSLGSSSSSSSSSSSPDPAVVSDWRSFRARLVATERAAARAEIADEIEGTTPAAPPAAPLGDKWAHALHEPEKGCLLIATEKLDGVHIFERTVILLLSAGPAGPTTGVILNRPSLMSIKETRSVALDVEGAFSDRPLFFGGPLEEGVFLVSPGEGSAAEGVGGVFEEVMEGVYYGTKESVGCAAEMVKRGAVGAAEFRFFDGYCGWERGQLTEEIRAGCWTVAACSAGVVAAGGAAGGGALWEDVLELVGERKVW